MEQQKEQIESYVSANMQEEVAREMKRAEDVARLVMDFN
jgi:hypothetical protein